MPVTHLFDFFFPVKVFDSERLKEDSMNGCAVFEYAVGTSLWVYRDCLQNTMAKFGVC